MLCDTCKLLDISPEDFVIDHNKDTTKFESQHELGTLHEIHKKSSHCALCRLIIEAACGFELPPDEREQSFQCKLSWQRDGFIPAMGQHLVRCLRIEVDSWTPFINSYNHLTLLDSDAPDGQNIFFGRRYSEKQINIKRIKKWIRLCQKWHGKDCQDPSDEFDTNYPPTFRLVDAWDRCIVEALSPCTYLALSYVWGQGRVFKLTTRNLGELKAAKGLERAWQLLPNTIQDAITLTSRLGFRYIWIDSLCILQDSDADKTQSIPVMGMIYHRAFMTIVAGSGEDAEAGLPGVRPYTRAKRQTIAEIRPGLGMVCPKGLCDSLSPSVYRSRAWT